VPKKPAELIVTDHAVLRYLERARGFDVEAIRTHIKRACTLPAAAGALSVKAEGVKFVLNKARDTVVTCSPVGIGATRTMQAIEGRKV
jgi:hypothetical protein